MKTEVAMPDASPAVAKKTRKNASNVWKHAMKTGNTATCNLCGTQIALHDSSTGSLRHHLQSRHRISLKSTRSTSSQSTESQDREPISQKPKWVKPTRHPTTRSSMVWHYMEWLDSENTADPKVMCRLCTEYEQVFSANCTTNIWKHLRKMHLPQYDELLAVRTAKENNEPNPGNNSPFRVGCNSLQGAAKSSSSGRNEPDSRTPILERVAEYEWRDLEMMKLHFCMLMEDHFRQISLERNGITRQAIEWKRLAEAMNWKYPDCEFTVEYLKTEWRALKRAYKRYRAQALKNKDVKWPFFKNMQFLELYENFDEADSSTRFLVEEDMGEQRDEDHSEHFDDDAESNELASFATRFLSEGFVSDFDDPEPRNDIFVCHKSEPVPELLLTPQPVEDPVIIKSPTPALIEQPAHSGEVNTGKYVLLGQLVTETLNELSKDDADETEETFLEIEEALHKLRKTLLRKRKLAPR